MTLQSASNSQTPPNMRLFVAAFVGLLLITSVLSQYNASYLGCYQDSGLRRLRGEYIAFAYQAQEMCLSYCKRWNYKYAGLQNGNQCFCGDEDPLESDRRPESECNSDCPGQTGKKCGGSWRNAIYSTGEVPAAHEYVGCYLDESKRRLKGYFKEMSDMAPRACINRCRSMNFKYAGLQNGNSCFCGNEDPDYLDKKSENECSTTCPLDYTSKCGAGWRNSIYKTLTYWNSTIHEYRYSDYDYMGCYQDSDQRRLRGEYIPFPYMTQEMCLSYCKKRYFRYAGLQNGNLCFCGDEPPVDSDKKPETECNSNCPGELGTKCGGGYRNAIYCTGEVPPYQEYIGCFLDESNRKLYFYYSHLSQMTPRSCTDRCRNMYFQYAGLQNGDSCFCSIYAPLNGDLRPVSDCGTTCPGDFTSKCGGGWRNSIYQTFRNTGDIPVNRPMP